MGFRQTAMMIKGAFNRLTGKVAPTRYLEEIEAHFKKLFPTPDSSHAVYHELVSEYVHIDVHRLAPTKDRPFYVLYTTGMSDLPMTFPDDTTWDFRKIHERAELFCLLPPDWFPPDDDDVPRKLKIRANWVVECLKKAARHPHMHKSNLFNGDLLRFTAECMPFADNTELCSGILIQLDRKDMGGKYGDDLEYFVTKDNSYINLLCFVPLYREEMRFRTEHEGTELFERLFGSQINDFSQLIIDTDRKNVCFDREI